MFISAAIISPQELPGAWGCIPGKVILRTLFCFSTSASTAFSAADSSCFLFWSAFWPRKHRNLSMFCPPFVCDNCERFVSVLFVYPYLSTMALCSGHSTHRQLQYRSSKANLSCLTVNIIVTDTPAIPSHRMNDPSVALKNGHPTSTLSQLVAIDYPPKLLAFCYAFACTIMHPLTRF